MYDGRLEPAEGNDRQVLLLAPGAGIEELAPSGLRFVGVEHEGCAQQSEEEASRIKQTYETLLAQRWVDRDGKEHPIGADDILVVSPYNMQVNLLKSVLPSGIELVRSTSFRARKHRPFSSQ